MKRSAVVGAIVSALAVFGLSGPAVAGEWAPGQDKLTPVKTEGVANSECAFSGRDQPDVSVDNPGGEPEPDDGLWATTPAKGKVQSPGQLVAAGIVPPGVPGEACRGGGPAGE